LYGKIFSQIYDGTLASNGPWQALVTFQQLIILCDRHGVVDMTPEAISRRTSIPLDIITLGIKALEEPDMNSRSPLEEGRRIVRLSTGRSWGWQLVNYEYYRNLRSEEERRLYHQRYYEEKVKPKRNSKDSISVNSVNEFNTGSKQYAVSSKHIQKALKPIGVTEKPVPPNPDVKTFMNFAFCRFEEMTNGEKMTIDGKKDGAIVKKLLGTYGLDRLKGLWDAFMQSDDPFIRKAGWSIGVFKSQVNKLVTAEHAPKPPARGLDALRALRERENHDEGRSGPDHRTPLERLSGSVG